MAATTPWTYGTKNAYLLTRELLGVLCAEKQLGGLSLLQARGTCPGLLTLTLGGSHLRRLCLLSIVLALSVDLPLWSAADGVRVVIAVS